MVCLCVRPLLQHFIHYKLARYTFTSCSNIRKELDILDTQSERRTQLFLLPAAVFTIGAERAKRNDIYGFFFKIINEIRVIYVCFI